MRRFLVGLFATIGILTLLGVLGVVGLAWWLMRPDQEPLPDAMLLTLDLRRPVLEGQPSLAASWLRGGEDYHLADLVQTLDQAARDPRVKAVYARLDETPRGFATTQELRQAIGQLREAGKITVAFADSFGELTPGNEGYYLASSFERIVLQPVGSLGLTGLTMEEPFARGLLEKLGVEMEVIRRSEYKTAFDVVTQRTPSEAHQEMSQSLLDSLDAQFRAGIEAGRPALAGQIGARIDAGPYTGQAALDAGLVDQLDYEDVVLSALVQGEGGGTDASGSMKRIALEEYQARTLLDPEDARARIALVHAVGPILRGASDFGRSTAAADEVAQALAAARADPDLKAVLFRISSPGGSAVASETIRREIERLKQAGKPVIVSMGDVAGSGGYWIAADADMILASPATLTGSIGVIAGKPVLDDLWDWLEVHWTTTSRGDHADIWSVNKSYSPEEQAKIAASVDWLYQSFKERVATARQLSVAEVEEIARGRVWTGAQAMPIGLVDRLGGLSEAILVAKAKIGLGADDQVALVPLPDPDQDLGRLLGRLSRGLLGTGVLLDRLQAMMAGGGSMVGMTPPSIR